MKSTIIVLLLGAVVAACSTTQEHPSAAFTDQDKIESVLKAVQELHGPPRDGWDLTELVSSRFLHDFNGDGQEELFLLFTDQGLGKLYVNSANDLDGIVTCGFMMLTIIDGRLWPVFYYFDEYRARLSCRTVLNVTGLVNEGGRGGVQTVWGWENRADDWPAQWTAFFRTWGPDKQTYGARRAMSRFLSNCGK